MSGWDLGLIVVRDGSHSSGERSALNRDVERGVSVRLRRGVYADRPGWDALSPEQRHIAMIRAVDEVSDGPLLFSHASAAVLHGLPVLRRHLTRVHTTAPRASERGHGDVAGHLFAVRDEEVVRIGPVRVTAIARTVVDIAGATPFGEGLMAADAALLAGVPRVVLEQAMDLAGPRQAARRIADVVAVAHPGAESAAESMTRSNLIRLGYEPPELQHALWDEWGLVAFLDFFFRRFRVGGEADGLMKYLDPALAPSGAGRAVVHEKLREDRVLPLVHGLARWGWREATNATLLRQKLARSGVHPASPRARIADYAAAARDAQPRRLVSPR
ncbi:hypothetical protein GCM10025783_26540 [Amnibacterium soli]|uniref:AbiEi antitoxin C-terminal domain-containing protein n=1 Tax=Amnibacterium soli TaxID=1282736 RepID=A0ABP8ZD43_9MICO